MEDENNSTISNNDDKDSLASGRISRWETEEYDQRSQLSDSTSITSSANISENESHKRSTSDSQSQSRTDSRTQSRNDSISASRNESPIQSLNEPQNQSTNSKVQNRIKSQYPIQNYLRNQSRNDSQNQSVDDSQSQSRNDSRNQNQNGKDSQNQNGGNLQTQGRNDSQNKSRNDSRNQSRHDSQNKSRNDSQNQSRNDSQNQSRYERVESQNDSINASLNESQKQSRNDSLSHSHNKSRVKSRNDSINSERNESQKQNIDHPRTQSRNDSRNTILSESQSYSRTDSRNQSNKDSRNQSRNDSQNQRLSRNESKQSLENEYDCCSRNTDQSISENDVKESVETENVKDQNAFNKESGLYDIAKEHDYRRASMPEVKNLSNSGKTEEELIKREYSYRIAAEIRRPLLQTRRRKRIYGSDMYTSDGDMRRENCLSRTQSDITQNRLLQRTNSQRKLSDVVSSDVFRVRRRMSMPVQHTVSLSEGQYNTEMEKNVESKNINLTEIRDQENMNNNDKNIQDIHSTFDDITVGQNSMASQNSKQMNNSQENSENTQHIEKHQSVYDIYQELRKMRQTAAECVGTEVRQTIEQKLDLLQSETKEKEEENNWRRIHQKIIKVRKKLKEQEEKEKEREQGYAFLLDILNDIISNVVSSCSDEKTQKSVNQTDICVVESSAMEGSNEEQQNTQEMTIGRTQSRNAVCAEGQESLSSDTCNSNKDIDLTDEEAASEESDDTVMATNSSSFDDQELEHSKSDNEYEDIVKNDSPAPGAISRVASREKVTFSLDEEQERNHRSDVDKNRSVSVSISRSTSATSSSGKTTPFENPFDSTNELDACMLEKVSDWSSSDSETEDTFISELETPDSKCNFVRTFLSAAVVYPRGFSSFRDRNDLGDEVISCIIQTSYGVQIPFTSSIEDPVNLPCIVDTYEVVLSYFVKLTSSDSFEPTQEDLFNIAIPYDREEMKYYQEPILRALTEDGKWKDVEFTDKIYNGDDSMCITVLETSLQELTVWAVVARPTIDYLKFDDKRNEAVSSTDNDISISVPPGSRYNPLDMKIELKVIPIISEILQEAKTAANDDMTILFRCSSLVTVDLEEEPSQPISIFIPCNKPYTRPQTGSRSSSRRSARRSATLRLGTADSGYRSVSRLSSGKLSMSGANEKREETENHLVRFGDGLPLKHKMIKPKEIDKHGKIVCTVLEKSCTCLIVEGRKYSKTPDLEKVVQSITDVLKYQKVHMCVIQSKLNVRLIKISCTLKSHVDCLHCHNLEKGHNLTHGGFRLTEGDVVRLSFRGNITPLKDTDKVFKFYGIHGFQTGWTIGVVDIYSQRSLEYFCGFVQIYKWKGETDRFDLNDWRKWQLVSEVQVTLPKSAPRASPFTSRAPVRIKTEGPITIEYLVSLANRIGDEWPQLARALRIEHARLQSIIQQNHNNMVANLVVDILLAWLKRSPHSKDKALVLAYALRHCGRKDLSDEVREKDRYHKMERSSSARESRMENAIQTVSRCPSASTRWKPLAQGLGLSDVDLMEIEHGYYDENQRCEQMLHLWKQKETEYRLKTLVSSLRHIGCTYVADHLESAKR